MTYTSNLNLLYSVVPTSASAAANIVTSTNALPVFNSSIDFLNKCLASYYLHNVTANSNINIEKEFLYLKVTDTNSLLTGIKELFITSNSIRQIRIIYNATNFSIIYGSVTIPSNTTNIIYDNKVISAKSNITIQDIYSYIPGLPNINTIYMLKRLSSNYVLIGGYAKAGVAATSNLTIDIWLNTYKVGTVVFYVGSSVGIVSVFGTIYINPIDNLYIKTQGIQDATLSNVGIVLNIIGE